MKWPRSVCCVAFTTEGVMMKPVPTQFDLDGGFPVPREITSHQVSGSTLLIAPTLPAWMSVNDAEADTMIRLSRGATLREAISCMRSWNVEDAEQALSSLLSRAAADQFLETNDFSESESITLQLHVTNKCNLRCKHCYVSSGDAFPNEVGVETWLKVIDAVSQRHKKVHLSISGGEPLLVSWLEELLASANSKGLRTSILSNGMLWTERRIEALKPYLDFVNISLDGASDSVHDAVRGKGSFRQAIRGISRLGEAGVEVGINVCLMRSNVADIEENLPALVASFPFKVSVLFAQLIEEGRGSDCGADVIPEVELRDVIKRLSSPYVDAGLNPMKRAKHSSCGFGGVYALYANGDVSPCLSPRYIAGNVVREPVEQVFDRVIDGAARANVDRLPLCRTCDLRYICGGKCHLPQLTTGKPIDQSECTAEYRQKYYQNLKARALRERRRVIPLVSQVM